MTMAGLRDRHMESFDLDRYLARIGYDGGMEPTAATLAGLGHARTLLFATRSWPHVSRRAAAMPRSAIA